MTNSSIVLDKIPHTFDWKLFFNDKEMQQELVLEDLSKYRFAFLWEPGMSASFFSGQLFLIKNCAFVDLERDPTCIICAAIIIWSILFLCFGFGSCFAERWKSF